MSADAVGAGPVSGGVLAITDLSPASSNAVWRAALIAREQGVALRVLHAQSDRARVPQAQQSLEEMRQQLLARLGIDAQIEVMHGELLPKALVAARAARLLVIGPRRANPLREWISGTQAERLIRLCRIPTLVVKRHATPGRNAALGNAIEPGRYGRVLVSVDLRPEAADLIAAAMRYSLDPQTQVFYAVGAASDRRLRANAPGGHEGTTAMQRAQAALHELIASSGVREGGVEPAVAFGRAADCVVARERATGAQLIVIGKRRGGLIVDFLLGGVTRQVLARSQADVLVMPERPRAAGAAEADRADEGAIFNLAGSDAAGVRG